jgi:hypothetical protein
MDKEPNSHLQQVLIRDLNGLLEDDGMVLPDREIAIAPDDVLELDVVDIVLGRNDTFRRTVCHLHQPSSDEYYWRHQTFVAWDDGRTAEFRIDLALNESESRTMNALPAARQALAAEFHHLIYRGVIDEQRAQDMEHAVLVELTRIKDAVDEALLEQDETSEGDNAAVIRTILEEVETQVPLDDAPSAEFDQLYAIIRTLRRAQYEAMELRERVAARYYALSDYYMDAAEANPSSMASPSAVWNLLDLLDKIR